MKAKKLCSPALTILKNDLKRFWALPLIALVILFMSGAFLILMGSETDNYYDNYYAARFFGYNNIGFLFAYILLGAGTGLLVFNYMVNRKASNYSHALPVTRGTLFAAHFTSGVIMIVTPVIVNSFILIAVTGLRSAGYYAAAAGTGILTVMVIYAFTVLAAVVSGNVIMHIFCSGFFNGLAIMILLGIYSYLNELLFGYSISEKMEELIKDSLVIFAFRNGPDIGVVISYAAVLVIVTILAYVIYKIRPVEKTGDSLVFGWAKMVFPGIVTFLGAALAGMLASVIVSDKSGLSAAMIIGLVSGFIISFVVITVITEKSQKIFNRRNLISFAATAVVMVLFVGSLQTDVMGYGNRVFAEGATDSAGVRMVCAHRDLFMQERLNADNFKGERQSVGKGLISGEHDSLMMLSDKNNIKEAIAIQKEIVSRRTQIENAESDADRYDLEYQYSAVFEERGNINKRGYEVIDPETEKTIRPHLKKIFESNEVKQAFSFSNLRYYIKSAEYISTHESDREDDVKTIPKEKLKGLIAAMDKDFREMTYDDYLQNAICSDDGEGKTRDYISLELHNKKSRAGKNKEYAVEDESYVVTMDIVLLKGSEHTKKWIRDNLD